MKPHLGQQPGGGRGRDEDEGAVAATREEEARTADAASGRRKGSATQECALAAEACRYRRAEGATRAPRPLLGWSADSV